MAGESVGDGAVGEVRLLEVAPASLDVVQFGDIFRQPLEGETVAQGLGADRQLAAVERFVPAASPASAEPAPAQAGDRPRPVRFAALLRFRQAAQCGAFFIIGASFDFPGMPGLHTSHPRTITHAIAHSQAVC